jgi:hypothetical protein
MQHIQYIEQGITFDFPLQDVLSCLQQLPDEPTDEPKNHQLLAWLQTRVDTGPEVIEFPSCNRSQRWGIIAELIKSGAGTVFCPTCNKSLLASTIKTEHLSDYGFDQGVAWAGVWLLLVCQQGHQILRAETYFGYQ